MLNLLVRNLIYSMCFLGFTLCTKIYMNDNKTVQCQYRLVYIYLKSSSD